MVIPEDKLKHLGAGFLCGFIVAFLVGAMGVSPDKAVLYGVVSSVLLGAGKEVYDHFNPPHSVELADAAATALGGVLGSLVTLIF